MKYKVGDKLAVSNDDVDSKFPIHNCIECKVLAMNDNTYYVEAITFDIKKHFVVYDNSRIICINDVPVETPIISSKKNRFSFNFWRK